MSENQLGQLYSLLAALTFAIALIFYRYSGQYIGPLALNLFKNVVAIILFAATLLFDLTSLQALAELDRGDWLRMLAAGLIGITLADTLFLDAINRLGVGLMVIVDCLYSPSAVVFAWLLFGEEIALIHLFGGVMVLGGIVLSSFSRDAERRDRKQLALGFASGVTAAVAMGFGIIVFDPVIEEHALLPVTAARLLIGTLPLLLFAGIFQPRLLSAFRPSRHWWSSIPAAVLASYLCLLFWHAGFKYTTAAPAAILNQMSTIFALVLAAVVLREPISRAKLGAVALAFVGALVVVTYDPQHAFWKTLTERFALLAGG